MDKSKTILMEIQCCKCHKDLGMGTLNQPFESNSFIPTINRIEYKRQTKIEFYCHKCLMKEIFDIDL